MRVSNWFQEKDLTLNTRKTKLCIIIRKWTTVYSILENCFMIGDEKIKIPFEI